MSQFLESIACENGQFPLLSFHQDRVNRTFAALYPGMKPIELRDLLILPSDDQLYKFRVMYDGSSVKIEHAPYAPKTVSSLKLVEAELDYSFKFLDRSQLVDLVTNSGSDDILIVKKGMITDSSYSNLAFYDGAKWWTPIRPLLAGVRRAYLLEQGQIHETDIRREDIESFKKVSLINAMLDLGELEVSIDKIS